MSGTKIAIETIIPSEEVMNRSTAEAFANNVTKEIMLWEIFVPCQTNDGKPIRTRQHREWDRRIRRISGGLSITKVIVGQWLSPNGTLFKERMIPVRIACTRKDIHKIIDLTLKFYNQEAVLCYLISDEVIVKYRDK